MVVTWAAVCLNIHVPGLAQEVEAKRLVPLNPKRPFYGFLVCWSSVIVNAAYFFNRGRTQLVVRAFGVVIVTGANDSSTWH
jgi:hypothetical protein